MNSAVCSTDDWMSSSLDSLLYRDHPNVAASLVTFSDSLADSFILSSTSYANRYFWMEERVASAALRDLPHSTQHPLSLRKVPHGNDVDSISPDSPWYSRWCCLCFVPSAHGDRGFPCWAARLSVLSAISVQWHQLLYWVDMSAMASVSSQHRSTRSWIPFPHLHHLDILLTLPYTLEDPSILKDSWVKAQSPDLSVTHSTSKERSLGDSTGRVSMALRGDIFFVQNKSDKKDNNMRSKECYRRYNAESIPLLW